MTQIGVFARVFPRGSPREVAHAIRAAAFTATQLNLSVFGRPTLDPSLTTGDAARIARAFAAERVRIWALSGTFNAIHPDEAVRAVGIDGARAVIARAPDLGAEVVTLCSGTRDPVDMWRAHPDNGSREAWAALRETLDRLIPAAASAAVQLGIEPEPGNVVAHAPAAARLLRELGADARHVAIVLDPANLLTVATLPQQESILRSAFERLGSATAAVHAKDVVASGYAAPGAGGMDYDLVLRLHGELPRAVPIIAQDLTAADAPRVHAFLAEHAGRVAASDAADRPEGRR